MSLAGLYPSSAGGSGVTLSPLSMPAAQTAAEAPIASEATLASPDPRSSASGPPAQPEDPDHVDDDEAEVVAMIDAEWARHQAEAESPPVDLTVDVRKNWFADTRMSEPAPSSVADYASSLRPPRDFEMDPANVDLALRAMVRQGIGVTAAAGFWNAAISAVQSPIKTTEAAAHAALSAEWGDKTDSRLEAARDYVTEMTARLPGLPRWLIGTGLGNDPGFIRQVEKLAQQRKGK